MKRLRSLSLFLAFGVSLMTLSGCVALVACSVGAVGGYAITRDTMQGEYDANYSKAWKSSLKVCGDLGIIVSRNAGQGTIEATVESAKVKVQITQITPEAIKVKVKARKGIFPRLGTAERVFVKIVQQIMD